MHPGRVVFDSGDPYDTRASIAPVLYIVTHETILLPLFSYTFFVAHTRNGRHGNRYDLTCKQESDLQSDG